MTNETKIKKLLSNLDTDGFPLPTAFKRGQPANNIRRITPKTSQAPIVKQPKPQE